MLVPADILATGAMLGREGRYDEALALARTMVANHPRDPRAWAELARNLFATGRRAEGLAAMERFERLAPQAPVTLNFIGRLYSLADLPARAAPFFRKAAAAPTDPRFAYDLAASLRMTGALDEARQAVAHAIALDPANTEAVWVRTDLGPATPGDNHIADLERRLQAPLDPQRESFLRYALAREYEEAGEWSKAFTQVERGAALQRRLYRYDAERDVAVLDCMRQHHTPAAVAAAGPGCEDPRPIFIVGLPRTGTTLVERVLGGHPLVRTIGESSAFDRALVDQALANGVRPDGEGLARQGLALPMRTIGEAYIAEAANGLPRRSPFLDKQPRNSLNVGLIRAALPHARILLVDRHPMDACWAIHKTLFLGGAYPFSTDLGDLADYYAAWRRMADHWLDAFGDAVTRVRYEDLVQDFPTQARRLVAACGLDWNPSCLAFHRSARPSSTASAVQVRRPLYATSIGLWRHHEAALAPLADRLTRLGVAID